MSYVRERAIEVMAIADWHYDDGDLPTWSELPEMAPGQQERSRERFAEIITALRDAGIVLVDATDVKIIADQWTGEIEGPDWDYVDMERDYAIIDRLKAALDPDATGTPGEGT